jgi:hypothetical protein
LSFKEPANRFWRYSEESKKAVLLNFRYINRASGRVAVGEVCVWMVAREWKIVALEFNSPETGE